MCAKVTLKIGIREIYGIKLVLSQKYNSYYSIFLFCCFKIEINYWLSIKSYTFASVNTKKK